MQLTREIFSKLKESVEFFNGFTDAELLGLLKSTSREIFKDGDIVFKEKTRGDKMYIIVNGCVRISRNIGNKQEEVLAKLNSGACFGEMGIIDGSPRSARATVEGGDALIMTLKEGLLREGNAVLAYKLYKNFSVMLANRLREANDKIQDFSVEDRSASSQLKDMVKKRADQGKALSGTNLRGADLSGIYLHNANLENAIMVEANMQHAKCKQANLKGAKLINGNFQSTDFSDANFNEADFTGSRFDGAIFKNCNMSGAIFEGAELTQSHMEELQITDTEAKEK